ncbi:hypothetical protein NECID01_1914 [Nematocida sp. AWRm77]|nr:hypothetical protein NECID01_1914 [Nematocida sp. AWRm77]
MIVAHKEFCWRFVRSFNSSVWISMLFFLTFSAHAPVEETLLNPRLDRVPKKGRVVHISENQEAVLLDIFDAPFGPPGKENCIGDEFVKGAWWSIEYVSSFMEFVQKKALWTINAAEFLRGVHVMLRSFFSVLDNDIRNTGAEGTPNPSALVVDVGVFNGTSSQILESMERVFRVPEKSFYEFPKDNPCFEQVKYVAVSGENARTLQSPTETEEPHVYLICTPCVCTSKEHHSTCIKPKICRCSPCYTDECNKIGPSITMCETNNSHVDKSRPSYSVVSKKPNEVLAETTVFHIIVCTLPANTNTFKKICMFNVGYRGPLNKFTGVRNYRQIYLHIIFWCWLIIGVWVIRYNRKKKK